MDGGGVDVVPELGSVVWACAVGVEKSFKGGGVGAGANGEGGGDLTPSALGAVAAGITFLPTMATRAGTVWFTVGLDALA